MNKGFIAIVGAVLIGAIFGCENKGGSEEHEKGTFVLEGKIDSIEAPVIYLSALSEEGKVVNIDSSTLVGGEFSFKGKENPLDLYFLNTPDMGRGAKRVLKQVYLPEGSYKASGNYNDIKIAGSKFDEIFQELVSVRQPIQDTLEKTAPEFYAAQASGDAMKMNKLSIWADSLQKVQIGLMSEVVKKYPDNIISANTIFGTLRNFMPFEELEASYLSLTDEVKKTVPGVRLKEYLDSKKKTSIGAVAPEISFNDPEGNSILLSSLRGKYVLIDFWASWCGPCRKENPNVVAMYHKFKDKGFDIYSVSLDGIAGKQPEPKTDWINAIEQDGLVWKSHVSDLKGWRSSVVKEYGFNGIPHSVLLDPDGLIIAKDLRGPALEEKLLEIFQGA